MFKKLMMRSFFHEIHRVLAENRLLEFLATKFYVCSSYRYSKLHVRLSYYDWRIPHFDVKKSS